MCSPRLNAPRVPVAVQEGGLTLSFGGLLFVYMINTATVTSGLSAMWPQTAPFGSKEQIWFSFLSAALQWCWSVALAQMGVERLFSTVGGTLIWMKQNDVQNL